MPRKRKDQLLTLIEAAEIAKSKPITLYKAIRVSKTLPGTKKGTVWLVWESDLDAWINNPDYHKRGPRVKS